MLPALGPSSLRDTLSKPFSSFLSITFHMTETDVNLSLKAIDALGKLENVFLKLNHLYMEIDIIL